MDMEIPDKPLIFDAAMTSRFTVGPSTVPMATIVEGVTGETERERDEQAHLRRLQQVAYQLAHRLVTTQFTALGDDPRPWLFPQLVTICRSWLTDCLDIAPGYSVGHVLVSTEFQAEVAEAIYDAIAVQLGPGRERLRPMMRRFDPVGSTANVAFATRKKAVESVKSEISHVTLDGKDGNTWEQILADECELHPDVAAYTKNEGIGFEIPYLHQGRTHSYKPDFLLRLVQRDDVVRTLIVEVSGGQKSPGPTKAKADTARNQWCVAVNNHAGFGRWGYVEIKTMVGVREALNDAINLLYADAPIIGDPELLDYDEVARGA